MTRPRCFDLKSGLLRVTAEDNALFAPLSTYLAPLAADCGPACFELAIARGAPEPPPEDLEVQFSGPLPEGGVGQLRGAAGRRAMNVGDLLSVRMEPTRAAMRVAPGGERFIGGSAGLLCIEAALRAAGQCLVHAAALIPRGREDAVLIFGPSGRGKTTTVLALALSGYAALTDDASVLGFDGGRPRVWGLPRPMKLHRNSLALLPALGAAAGGAWDEEGEQSVSQESLRGLIDLPGPVTARVAGVVWLGERTPGAHRLRPSSRADLLAHLASDNVGRGPSGVPEDALERFTALARTVAACPAYELRVGGDLASLAAELDQALAS